MCKVQRVPHSNIIWPFSKPHSIISDKRNIFFGVRFVTDNRARKNKPENNLFNYIKSNFNAILGLLMNANNNQLKLGSIRPSYCWLSSIEIEVELATFQLFTSVSNISLHLCLFISAFRWKNLQKQTKAAASLPVPLPASYSQVIPIDIQSDSFCFWLQRLA